jgi:hypothetical protein
MLLVAASQPDGQVAAIAEDAADRILKCRPIATAAERLACFDRESARMAPPRWQGRLSLVTEQFTVDEATVLRFASEGVIFVLYVKDATGEVVQNLHIGGGGEDQYVIEKPGRYFLQINGSEGWRIWLEPLAPAKHVEAE